MSSIYKRKNKLWISYYVNGKEFRDPLGLDATRQGWIEARKVQKVKDGELALGNYQLKIKTRLDLTLKKANQIFIKTKKNKSPATIKNYEAAFQKFENFCGDIRLNRIDTKLVEKFEYHLRNTPFHKEKILTEASIATYFRALRIIFTFFVEKGFIKVNPFPKKKIPETEIVTIPSDELEKILEELKKNNYEWYKTIVMFLLTGLRASELVRLEYADINLEKNLLTIKNSKGRRDDLFPIYPKLRRFILENFQAGEGKLFNYKSRHSFKFWKRFLAGTNIEKKVFSHYTIHQLRKTFISNLANDGVNIFDVSKLARHHDIRTTMKSYAQVELSRLGNCINDSAKIHTIIHTSGKNALKLVGK